MHLYILLFSTNVYSIIYYISAGIVTHNNTVISALYYNHNNDAVNKRRQEQRQHQSPLHLYEINQITIRLVGHNGRLETSSLIDLHLSYLHVE